MKEILSIFLFLAFLNLNSQNSIHDYHGKIKEVFSDYDLSSISNSFLKEYGMELVDLNAYDGVLRDSNYIDINVFYALYQELISSKVNHSTSENHRSSQILLDYLQNSAQCVDLAVLNFSYFQFSDSALINESIVLKENKILRGRRDKSPFIKKNLFAAAPTKNVFYDKRIKFKAKKDLYFTEDTQVPYRMYVSFENGAPY